MGKMVWTQRYTVSALALLAAAGAAQAQTTAPAADPFPLLEEIVVTAERRSESLQDTPLSILTFSGDALEKANVRSVDDLQNFLPNVSIGGSAPVGNSAPNFSIRGVGQTSGRANNEKGVGLYVDDVYYPRSTGAILNLLDVERIEVLRGPQGTLFGRNTTGGAIRYITRKPSDELEGRITGTYGSHDRTDIEGILNVPISDKVAFRGQGAYFKRDGYVDVIGTDRTRGNQDDYAIRGALRLKPNDNILIDLTAAYTENRSNGSPTVIAGVGLRQASGFPIAAVNAYNAYLASKGQTPIVADDPRFVSPDGYSVPDSCIMDEIALNPAKFGDAPNLVPNSRPQASLCDDARKTKNTFLSADIGIDINDALSLRSITGYNKGTDIDQGDYGLFGAQTNYTLNEMDSLSQELQLLGSHEGVEWVAGLYYFHETPAERRFLREAVVNAGRVECCNGFDANVQLKTNSYSAFGQATLDLTDKARVTAGARYSYDDKDVFISKVGIFTPALPAGGSPRTNANHWDAIDYRLTLDYQWTDALMTYATYSKGFKSGGFNVDIVTLGTAAPTITSFDPETVKNLEAGVRSEWFDKRLRANLTGFHMKYDNLVVQLADFSRGALQVLFLNAGKLEIDGFEGEFAVVPVERLTLNANVGYTKIKYVDLPTGSPLFDPASCPGGALTFDRCWAQPLARSPEWTYTLGAQYSIPAGEGDVSLNANYAFKASQYSNNSTSNSVKLPSYGVANVRVEYDSGAQWKVAAFGTNIFDKYYITTGTNGRQNTLATLTHSPGRPAEYGVSLTWSF